LLFRNARIRQPDRSQLFPWDPPDGDLGACNLRISCQFCQYAFLSEFLNIFRVLMFCLRAQTRKI